MHAMLDYYRQQHTIFLPMALFFEELKKPTCDVCTLFHYRVLTAISVGILHGKSIAFRPFHVDYVFGAILLMGIVIHVSLISLNPTHQQYARYSN